MPVVVRTLAVLILMLFAVSASAENWPQFRGPWSDRWGPASCFPLEWDVETNSPKEKIRKLNPIDYQGRTYWRHVETQTGHDVVSLPLPFAELALEI